MNSDQELAALLNNESFVQWIKGEARVEARAKWDHWLNDSPSNQLLVNKAEKIISMPFSTSAVSKTEITKELEQLKEKMD